MNILNILDYESDDNESYPDKTKRCENCKKDFPLTEFHTNPRKLKRGTKIYYYSICKTCVSKNNNSPEGKDKYFRRTYKNFSHEKYQQILESQNNSCWICKCKVSDPRNKVKPNLNENADLYFSVDHDHKTGIVRGLLCKSCNTSLGGFDDSKELLQRAIEYLEEKEKDFIIIYEPTPLADGKIEFVGDRGEKFYEDLEKLAKHENKTVDETFGMRLRTEWNVSRQIQIT